MNVLKDLIKKHGTGSVLGLISLDSYRRLLESEKHNSLAQELQRKRTELEEAKRATYDKELEVEFAKVKLEAAQLNFKEAAETHVQNLDKQALKNDTYHQNEVLKSKKVLDDKFEELTKKDFSEILTSFYNNYVEYLDTLTADKLVCIFNLFMFSSLFSSFFSVLSILLSENIINNITWLDKFPKILYLLKLRNNINKKIIKVYVLTHLFFILLGFIGNLYMFFL